MELYPLVPPDLPQRVDRGHANAIIRGRPSTVSEVLGRARLEMEAEDRAEEYRNDPLRYIGRHRPPRRTLGRRLLRGRER